MIEIKVDEMDKYQLTEAIKKVREIIYHPDTEMHDVTEEMVEEINNPPTDNDGYVHKYYLNEFTKHLIEVCLRHEK